MHTCIPDTLVQKWDFDHYMKVRQARLDQGIKPQEKPMLTEHPLFNKVVRNKVTGKSYVIESIRQGWWKGPYLHMVARQLPGDSHAVMMTEADRCLDDSIRHHAEQFATEFEVVS